VKWQGMGRSLPDPHRQKALTGWPSVVLGSQLDAGRGRVEAGRPPRLGVGDRAAQVGMPQMLSFLQLGTPKIGPSQVRAMQAHVAELGVHEKRTTQVRVAQGGPL
jgi:hypothetical protein